ncbi:hypothetical protein [Streptosporangium sp. CA-115845]|uniref:hypothetical protein n=1 Tax=Streptosporangium sp. CA-115845 TaxID=3240071 RepID=UPI003D8A44CB
MDDLRRLRDPLSLEEVGRRMKYHPNILSRRLTPKELPSQKFVHSYVTACGAAPEPWNERWRELARSTAKQQTAEPRGTDEKPETTAPR